MLAPEFRENIRHVYNTFAGGRDDNPGELSASCQLYIVQDKSGKVETDATDTPLKAIDLDVNIILMSEAELLTTGFSLPS
ncbi:MAG: peptidyl-prolyl cis-trans isomerase B (cyclophilin B) [Candidatus Azotimanducaceae bacterium]